MKFPWIKRQNEETTSIYKDTRFNSCIDCKFHVEHKKWYDFKPKHYCSHPDNSMRKKEHNFVTGIVIAKHSLSLCETERERYYHCGYMAKRFIPK